MIVSVKVKCDVCGDERTSLEEELDFILPEDFVGEMQIIIEELEYVNRVLREAGWTERYEGRDEDEIVNVCPKHRD